MNFSKELDQLIQKGLQEKTFSLEVIDTIKALKDDYEKVSEELNTAAEMIKNLKVESAIKHGQILDLEGYKSKNINREGELEKREKEIQKLELQAQYAELRRADALNIVQTVFRSPVYTKTTNGYYPGNGSTSIGTTEVVEQH